MIFLLNKFVIEDYDDWFGEKGDWDVWLVDVFCVDLYVIRIVRNIIWFNIFFEIINYYYFFNKRKRKKKIEIYIVGYIFKIIN